VIDQLADEEFMIFNNFHKRSLRERRTTHPQRSAASSRPNVSQLNGHVHSPEADDDLLAASESKVFTCDDFIFLSDTARCWVVRTSDIWTLEACGNYTRITLSDATALIRRPLRECECKLDPSTFFRTRRDCIVNLSRVKQMRMLDAKRFLFVLLDGREVAMSRKQSLLFRKQKSL
jgi:DNA-binding LytR/AlgR family response regulator